MSKLSLILPLPMIPKILLPSKMIAIVANAANAVNETNTATGLVIESGTARDEIGAENTDGIGTVTATMT
jgi:hypothetical protein